MRDHQRNSKILVSLYILREGQLLDMILHRHSSWRPVGILATLSCWELQLKQHIGSVNSNLSVDTHFSFLLKVQTTIKRTLSNLSIIRFLLDSLRLPYRISYPFLDARSIVVLNSGLTICYKKRRTKNQFTNKKRSGTKTFCARTV